MRSGATIPAPARAVSVTALGVAILSLSLSGCRFIPFTGDGNGKLSEQKALQLEERLQEYQSRFVKEMSGAAVEVERASTDPLEQVNTLYFQILFSPYPRDAAFGPDPLSCLLDLWALAVQTRVYFESGPGKAIFGERAVRFAEAAQELETEIERIASLSLEEKALGPARTTVQRFAAEFPATRPFSRDSIRPYLEARSSTVGFSWLLDTSLSPLRAIGGLDQTAVALHEISRSADEMTSMVKELPDRIRLQSRILLYEAETNPGVATSIASLERVSKSGEQLAATAEALPERVGKEVSGAIRELEEASPELRATVTELRSTLESLEKSLEAATRTSDGIATMSERLESAIGEFRGLMGDFRGEPAAAAPSSEAPPSAAGGPTGGSGAAEQGEPKGKPFDIEEYTRAAEAIAGAAAELRSAIVELRTLAAADESKAAIDRAAATAEGLAGRVTLYVVLGFAGCAAVVLALRVLSRRFDARARGPSGGKGTA